MFCTKCGTQIPDDTKFCPNCGTSLTPLSEVPRPAPGAEPVSDPPFAFTVNAEKPAKKKTGLLIGLIAGGVVLVIGIVVLLTLLLGGKSGGRSPESVVTKYFESVIDGDFETAVALSLPDKLLATRLEEEGMTRAEYKKQLKYATDSYLAYAKMDPDMAAMQKSFQCKILDIEQLERDDIFSIDENYNYEFDTPFGTVTDAVDVYFVVSYTYADDEPESDRDYITVVKIDGSWYIDYDSDYSLQYVGFVGESILP